MFEAEGEAAAVPALVAGDRSLSYAELADEARSAVGWLEARSPDRCDPVAVVAHNDVPTLLMIHGLLARATPVVLLHPRLTASERDTLLTLVAESWPGRRGEVVVVVPRGWQNDGPAPGASVPPWPGDDAAGAYDPEDAAAVVFTSGTTGHPRGVVLSRRAFTASAAASAANLGWEAHDRWLLPLPVAHVGGLSIVTRCLLARRTVVLTRDTDPSALLATMERQRVTLASVVPTLLARLLDLDPAASPPSSLRALLVGGAATPPSLLDRAADRGWPVLTTYGLTEACSQVTTQPYGTVNRGALGAGPPLPGIDLRIGADDEIQVRGPTLFDGYLEAGELVRPVLDGGWLATGDSGRLDGDGNLHVLGRRVDRIVTGGENVDPAEVERALESLDGVREACVVGVPDEEWGEAVAAAVVLDPDADLVLEAETPRLRERLAPFKLPRRLLVVETLPRNALGKLDRSEVRRRFEADG